MGETIFKSFEKVIKDFQSFRVLEKFLKVFWSFFLVFFSIDKLRDKLRDKLCVSYNLFVLR